MAQLLLAPGKASGITRMFFILGLASDSNEKFLSWIRKDPVMSPLASDTFNNFKMPADQRNIGIELVIRLGHYASVRYVKN